MENKSLQILILEDDLETLSTLFHAFALSGQDISPIVLSEYWQVEELINCSDLSFDVILLDRDCNRGGSFHTLNIEKFGVDKVIGISSMPPYNDELRKRGVTLIVDKDYGDLKRFADKIMAIVVGIAGEIKTNP